jgi:Zn-dependent protease
MFGRGSVTLFRARGVPVRAHFSLLIILPYLAIVFSARFAQLAHASGVAAHRLLLPPVAWGLLLAIGLFASVLVHEMAHTVLAVRAGGRVRGITLMLLGGVSEIERMPERPSQEAIMAAAGPATSLAIGVLLLLLGRLPLAPDARFGLFYLGRLNIVLAAFNLLPAFPMDGGRVLRALLATRIGAVRATLTAARIGRFAAIGLGVLGAVSGNFLLLFIALFLYSGADFEARTTWLRDALGRIPLVEIMATPVPAVAPDAPLREARDRMRRAGRRDLVVVRTGGTPVGIVRAEDLSGRSEWRLDSDRVRDLGVALARRFLAARPEDMAGPALEHARAAEAEYVLVMGEAGVEGIVGPTELENAIALHARPPRRSAAVERPVY